MREVQTHVFAEQLILFLSSEVLLSSEVQTHVFADELILLFTMTMGKEEEKQQQQQQQQQQPWASERFLEREESSFERDNFRAVVSVGEEVSRGHRVLSVFPSTGFSDRDVDVQRALCVR